MKNNTWTIIGKEFARFFGDRQLVFTAVIMPGLLIYLIYTLMGHGINKMVTQGAEESVEVQVANMPTSLEPILTSIDTTLHFTTTLTAQEVKTMVELLDDKDLNMVLIKFPEEFDEMLLTYNPQSGVPAPNIEIYYNSANNASSRAYLQLQSALGVFEDGLSNRFDINRTDSPEVRFDRADSDGALGIMVWSKILPMLIVMMLFSGVMSIAPSSIAGEKERGTIATLLVTPMRRNQLALGKIISLSCIGILSGISSFVGIALSLPNMVQMKEGIELGFHYSTSDYLTLLLVIIATVLIMASAVSLLSALAKDVKNAGTMVTPLMLVVMIAGLIPMFQSEASTNLIAYLIPFYNSIEAMTALFAHEPSWPLVLTTVGSNIAYTALAVWALTKMFNSEKVMFSR